MPRTTEDDEPRAIAEGNDPVAMGRAVFLAGGVERARRMVDEVLTEDPMRTDAWILKGRTLVCRFDPVGARKCYTKALEIDNENKEAWSRKAFAHRVEGELSEAIECWKRALELDGEDHRILNDIASAMDDMSEYDSAIEYYERALVVNPEDPFAMENIRLNQRILKRISERKKAPGAE